MTEPTGTIYDQMTAAVQRVAEAREKATEAKALLAEHQAEFDARHAATIIATKMTKEAVAESEATAKALAEAHFQVTGEKKPVPGIEVKEKTELDYTDADALAFCKPSGLCIIPEHVDRKAFDKVARASDLSFVTKRVVPQVQLASDLTAALAKEPA